MKNYYAILEVPVGCSLEEIRQAYHRLVQAHLDDEAVFADLKEAYEVLTTPTHRAEYDKAAWGETFDAQTTVLTVSNTVGLGVHCPMGADGSCPVVQGRAAPAETFCPDCGYALAGLSSNKAFDPATQPDPAQAARLEGRNGFNYPLRPGTNSVGREGTDVLVFDKTVSRNHAKLEVAEGGGTAAVEDLGSTNGTQVGGERLLPNVPRTLANGSVVQFGSVALTLRLPENAAAPESVPPILSFAQDAHAQMSGMQGGGVGIVPLKPGLTTFGRRPENTIVLAGDLYVSGAHAQISADGDVFILTDTGSTNGTLLNGERLPINMPVTLGSGDVVVIGATALRFDRLGPDGEVLQAADGEETQKDEEAPNVEEVSKVEETRIEEAHQKITASENAEG